MGSRVKKSVCESTMASYMFVFPLGIVEMQAAGGVQSKEIFMRDSMAVLHVCFSLGIVKMQPAGGVQSKEILTQEQHCRPTCLFFLRIC